jgi:hypothetical protein
MLVPSLALASIIYSLSQVFASEVSEIHSNAGATSLFIAERPA